jgi:DNA-binding HxlR family transcriptional regulator
MRDERFCKAECSLTRAVGKIGNKWKPIIIHMLNNRTLRFGQLDAIIPMITRKVLTEQLRELEEDGILIRNAFSELPPRVEYSLSKQGLELLPIFQNMMDWNSLHEKNTIVMQ